ncbi:hypothetical protein A3740_07795 [Oleiphilus sp. HI0068]|nr:hypothetical protein A3740_07795 [Oleiphilus sp. HI0068]
MIEAMMIPVIELLLFLFVGLLSPDIHSCLPFEANRFFAALGFGFAVCFGAGFLTGFFSGCSIFVDKRELDVFSVLGGVLSDALRIIVLLGS